MNYENELLERVECHGMTNNADIYEFSNFTLYNAERQSSAIVLQSMKVYFVTRKKRRCVRLCAPHPLRRANRKFISYYYFCARINP